jgi:hypothetical protein
MGWLTHSSSQDLAGAGATPGAARGPGDCAYARHFDAEATPTNREDPDDGSHWLVSFSVPASIIAEAPSASTHPPGSY